MPKTAETNSLKVSDFSVYSADFGTRISKDLKSQTYRIFRFILNVVHNSYIIEQNFQAKTSVLP